MFDKYYTDSKLAETLVSSLPNSFDPLLIADFAAGEGSLLKAARKRWNNSTLLANDYCLESTNNLRSLNFQTYNVDFLCSNEVNNSSLMNYANSIDLILLNPPFNQKKVKLIEWIDCQEHIKSGIALYFVFKSMFFLKPDGYLLAILPNGCLMSERDKPALDFISRQYTLEVIKENCDSNFKNARPRISIVKIRNTKPEICLDLSDANYIKSNELDIIRGNIQMHKVGFKRNFKTAYPLVHTTNLRKGYVEIDNRILVGSDKIISGPAILLPRVGSIDEGKVCYLPSNKSVAISDCIFAILCDDETHAEQLKAFLFDKWVDFRKIYGGTGALYTTLSKLRNFFNEHIFIRI